MRKKTGRPVVMVILLIVCICVLLTIFILQGMFPDEEKHQEVSGVLENVYVWNTSEDRIDFAYDGRRFSYAVKADVNYTGVADLEVRDSKLMRISAKPDVVEARILAYTPERVQIEGYGAVDWDCNLPVYEIAGEQVRQSSLEKLIVGTTEVGFTFDNGKVCALVVQKPSQISNIHVLLKNGATEFREHIWIRSDAVWTVGERSFQANQVYGEQEIWGEGEEQQQLCISSGGKFYLCNADGSDVSEGYEGNLTIQKYEEGYVIVNTLPVEDYVRYVLPSEMPKNFSMEALKAQAVCARTFAFKHLTNTKYAKYGANLDDTTAYQVYNQAGNYEQTNEATWQTAGEVLYHGDEMITCYYFSTSPGVTENFEVWGTQESPAYLVRTSCLKDGQMPDVSKEKNFLKFIHSKPDAYDSDSAFYRWKAKVNLLGLSDENFGKALDIQVNQRSKSGYVTRLTIVYESGEMVLENENQIRNALGKGMTKLILANEEEREFSTIPSACFALEKKEDGNYILYGGGFGHGIGLSQYGANAQAKEGKNYRDILQFYYKDVEIRNQSMI